MRFLFFLLFMFAWAVEGQCEKTLKVAVVESPPFVMKKEDVYTGIAVDLWKEIAENLELPYVFVEHSCKDKRKHFCKNTDKPFELLGNGEADVFVGAISVTEEGYEKADFTLPYFVDKLVAITLIDYMHSALNFIKMFLISAGGLIFLFFLFFSLYIHLLWHYEKAYAPNIPSNYVEGISHLFWTHVISGHYYEVPKSRIGKIIILFQKAAFYLILIMLNATLISFMTVSLSRYANPIQNIADLQNKRIGAVNQSVAYKTATDNGLRVIAFDSFEEGVKALHESKINAFLEDFSTAEYYFKENEIVDLNISHFDLKRDLYVFATRIGSPLLREINVQMLKLRKLNAPEKICGEYFIEGVRNCEM